MNTATLPQPASDTNLGRWHLNDVHPDDLLELLPRMDRVMIALRASGFMHERLGVVSSVTCINGQITIAGPEQDMTLPEGTLARAVLDISIEMRGKLYPKLEFFDGERSSILSVTGLEGPGPFERELSDFSRKAAAPAPAPPRSDDPSPDIAPDDPGLVLLRELCDLNELVQIRARYKDVVQRWTGVMDKITPMGGYINVMTPGFHLHLAACSVADWRAQDGIHCAIDKTGQRIGLEVVAP